MRLELSKCRSRMAIIAVTGAHAACQWDALTLFLSDKPNFVSIIFNLADYRYQNSLSCETFFFKENSDSEFVFFFYYYEFQFQLS